MDLSVWVVAALVPRPTVGTGSGFGKTKGGVGPRSEPGETRVGWFVEAAPPTGTHIPTPH